MPKFKAGWREIGGRRINARSSWEANYARYLQDLKMCGVIKEWEHEPNTFWFEKIRRGVRSYLPDFRVTYYDGGVDYREVKGRMDGKSLTKIRRMKRYYPKVVLIIVDPDLYGHIERTIGRGLPGWES